MELKKAVTILNKLSKSSLSSISDYYRVDGNYIYSTNLDVGIKIKVNQLSENTDNFFISKDSIKKIIKIKRIDSINIKDDLLNIVGSVNIKTNLADNDDYPNIPSKGNSIGSFKTPKSDISWYCSKDPDRENLACVYVDSSAKRLVATDGHVAKLEYQDFDLGNNNLFIFAEGFKLLDKECEYNVSLNKKHLQLDATNGTSDISIIIRRIDEDTNYPDIDRVIPKLDIVAPIDLNEFKDIVKEINSFLVPKSKLLILDTNVKDGYPEFNKLNILNTDTELIVNKEISLPNFDMPQRGFNGEYLLYILNDINLETNKFYINNTVIWSGMHGAHYFKNDTSLTLIMPLKIHAGEYE